MADDYRNRKPPNGYRLSRVAFSKGFPKPDKSSTNAEQELMWNKDNAVCPGECFRPVGLTFDAEGKRVFMTSDSSGELYVVTGTDTCQYRSPGLVHQRR